MAGEISTIQSLKAVDAWIDVINANINGGVRTAFKSSRLKFSGSNIDVQRAGNSTNLPLQFPEPGLTTANTIIDFSQGAVTASTEDTHLALQGPGFFRLVRLSDIDEATGYPLDTTSPVTITGSRLYSQTVDGFDAGPIFYSRDGEFRVIQSRANPNRFFLANSQGLILLRRTAPGDTGGWSGTNGCRAFTWDVTASGVNAGNANSFQNAFDFYVANIDNIACAAAPQQLQYSRYGSTIFQQTTSSIIGLFSQRPDRPTVLQKSLEASNASMTQSVPELSLAQKLFSALTKVLQTKQTNVDGVLNLVR